MVKRKVVNHVWYHIVDLVTDYVCYRVFNRVYGCRVFINTLVWYEIGLDVRNQILDRGGR